MPTTISRTWYNTLVDDDGSNTVGSVWDKADVDAILDAIDAIFAASVSITGELTTTLGIKAGSAGTVVSGFVDGFNMGTWDMFGYNSAGTKVAVGGYRAAQWSELGMYTSGNERININTSGVVKFNAYTAATFAAGDKYLVVSATGVIHVSALGPAS